MSLAGLILLFLTLPLHHVQSSELSTYECVILPQPSMALLQEIYHGLDPLTPNAIIEIQLEDSATLAGSAKGKQREGTVNDAEVALQMFTEDLHTCQRVLEDRKMARSIALAVHRDGSLISRAHQQEDQIARDHQLAASLMQAPADDEFHATRRAPPPQQDKDMNDPWVSDELLEKAAALYDEDSVFAGPVPSFDDNDNDSDQNETTLQPESSAWGASRAGKAKQKLGHCVACGDIKDFFDVARVPCDHEYCRGCLASLFQASMKDESLFPPRCDGQPISLNQVRFFLPVELAKEFEERSVELSAKN